MNKTFSLGIAGVIVGAIIVAAFALTSFSNANGPFTSPAITANIATSTTVGPDTQVTVAASSSRSYLRIARQNLNAAVICNANGTQIATTTGAGGVAFTLSTTTGESFEFFTEKNPYDGSVVCYASASTTLTVYELKRQ